jgi:RES domain-containing protein
VVYTSGTLSLATLEVLVNVDHNLMPLDFVKIEINIPDHCEIERINQKKFPSDWRSYPSPEKLQQLGNLWLEEERTPVLEIPSAVIPEEINFLINPAHADAKIITIASASDFQFDPRLFN